MNTIQTFKAPTGHSLTTIAYKGQPCWIAQEVGAALGYSANGSKLVNKITQDWSDEFIEGVDCFKLESEDLADLRRSLKALSPESGDRALPRNARNLLLLTREGFYLSCLKTNKPIGVQLRRWLASEVLPAMERGEFAGAPASTFRRSALVSEVRAGAALAKELLRAGLITTGRYGELLRDGICQLRPEAAQILAGVGERGEDGGDDRARAAMEHVLAWARTHEGALYDRGRPSRRRPSGGWLGAQGEGELAIATPVLSDVLIGAGYSPIATRRLWMERGWIRSSVGRDGQVQRRIDGARAWVVVIDKGALDQVED